MRRLDETGPDALVQLPKPVNRFPDFVRYAVQQLKSLCPSMGKLKIPEVLARAGLHLGTTTVGRILKEHPVPPQTSGKSKTDERHVTADRPNHVWHVDLTTVPISGGFWALGPHCLAPVLAVLLVGGHRARPFLASGDGFCYLHGQADLSRNPSISRNHSSRTLPGLDRCSFWHVK